MRKHLNKPFSQTLLLCILCLAVTTPAWASVSDLANGWTFWRENGAVLMTWERPSGPEASRILGYEIWPYSGLRDIVLRGEDEFWRGYYIDASEPAGIAVLDVEIDSVTGEPYFEQYFIYWLPDEEGNPTWTEFLSDNWDLLGTDLTDTSVHYGWVPSGPVIGQPQIYQIRPIIIVQDRNGQWHIQLGELSDLTANQVIPVGPPWPTAMHVTGNLAKFEFDSTFGTDEAILQVARDQGTAQLISFFMPEWTHSQVITPINPFSPDGNHFAVEIDLAQVPGSGNIFWWRVGSRNRRSTERALPWPATPGYAVGSTDDPDHGWVWSNPQWASVASHFTDVWPGFWAFPEIEAIAQDGIVKGFPDSTYKSALAVARDAMAVYLARSLAGSDEVVPAGPATASFSDVSPQNWAYKHIEYLASRQVVKGFSDGTYQPEISVTRDQIAVYIARAKDWISIDDDMTTAPALFPDVPAGFWAGTAIEVCVEKSVTKGYPDGNYQPDVIVRRDQMAVFIYRAFFEED